VYDFRVEIGEEDVNRVSIRVYVGVQSRFLKESIHGSCISRTD
jgi:hypothetical protein